MASQKNWRRTVVPLGVSLAAHAVLALALLAGNVTWSVPDRPAKERTVMLSVSPSAPTRAEGSAPAGGGGRTASPDPVRTELPPPASLAGLSTEQSRLSSLPPSSHALPDSSGPALFHGASFAGRAHDRAASVVFAVDVSGSMVTSLPFVVEELRRSVAALVPVQHFQIVLFSDRFDGGATVFGDGSLVRATRAGRDRVADWLTETTPGGRSTPLAGLRRAMAMHPELVFLLARSIRRSDGTGESGAWGAGRREILAELDRLNPVGRNGNRGVVIQTIQFLDEDPTGIMRAIADLHGQGGADHRVLTLDELRRGQ